LFWQRVNVQHKDAATVAAVSGTTAVGLPRVGASVMDLISGYET
jgi:hypothetical protein